MAASGTTNLATRTMVAHFAKCPESLEKVRSEFNDLILEPAMKLDATLENDEKKDLLAKTTSFEMAQDLEYMNQVMCETLRFQAPLLNTSFSELDRDTKVGQFVIKKGDTITVNLYGLHFNSDQWQRPYEFLPERFDSMNPLSLTPDGKKRLPTAFAPFGGGRRVCMGKTLAEANLKVVGTYLSQYFNFELLDQKRYGPKCNYPRAHSFMNGTMPVMVRLTEYNKQKVN